MIYQDSKKITIIMVDDEPGLRDVFEIYLSLVISTCLKEMELLLLKSLFLDIHT